MPAFSSAADIGAAIASARKAAGLSQKKLGAMAGTSQAVVSGIESGKETAHVGIVLRLIAALGLVVDIREPDGTVEVATRAAKAAARRPDNVVFDEPLPDDSIDLDAIVGGKPRSTR